tara:strand:+ start:9745 stop:10587 length:843 start_codon:yes stop_codon:yes gene_type:complete
MQVIILSGQAKSGKSYLASLIAEEVFRRGYIPVIDNFAAPIKTEAESVGLNKEENHDSFRRFCQDFGRMKRTEDPEYFVRKAAERLSEVSKEEALDISNNRKHWERVVIFDDCRYPNECKFGKAVDAVLVFVTRGDKLPDQTADWREHESEHMSRIIDSTGFESHFDEVFDVFVINDGKKKDLEKLVKERVQTWLSVHHPNFGDCLAEGCNCPLCVAKRDGTIPDPTEVLEYILRKLTGRDFTPEQLDALEDQMDEGGTPRIDIDFMISFEDEDEEDEEA